MRSVAIVHKDTMALAGIYRPSMLVNLQRNKTNKQNTVDRRLSRLTVQQEIKLSMILQDRPGWQNHKASP